MFRGIYNMVSRLRDDLLIETNPNPLSTMSAHYTRSLAKAETKRTSRVKIWDVLQTYSHGKKVIHHLGGRNVDIPFEKLFGGVQKKTSFVRYEAGFDITPKKYVPAMWNDDFLNDRKNTYGWFVAGDFWENFTDYTIAINDATHHFWLDFCGMPTPELVDEMVAGFDNNDFDGEVFATFFLNPRVRKDVEKMVKKYGKGLEDRAKATCEYLNEKFELTEWEVFDTYINGRSPMAVFRMKRNNMTTKTKKKPVVGKRHSAEQYAVECKRFSNKQLTILWKKSTMQIAGYAAQAKRKGLIAA